MQSRSHQTITIEEMLKTGKTVSAVARDNGVSRQRVQQIKRRLVKEGVALQEVAPPAIGQMPLLGSDSMKALTIRLTPAVFKALTEACLLVNKLEPNETTTVEEYAEECIMLHLVERGLLRKNVSK